MGVDLGGELACGLTVGADAKDLYLAVLFLFRIGHPPFFIPWTDISVTLTKRLVFTYLEFHFRRVPEVPLWVSERLDRRLAAAAGRSWPGDGGHDL